MRAGPRPSVGQHESQFRRPQGAGFGGGALKELAEWNDRLGESDCLAPRDLPHRAPPLPATSPNRSLVVCYLHIHAGVNTNHNPRTKQIKHKHRSGNSGLRTALLYRIVKNYSHPCKASCQPKATLGRRTTTSPVGIPALVQALADRRGHVSHDCPTTRLDSPRPARCIPIGDPQRRYVGASAVRRLEPPGTDPRRGKT
jgi:hypothetical protein